jgi:hypothetical protein
MVRKASGVNPELMGMAEAGQAGVLEYQRRQSALQTLAPYFDALRRARKDIGRALLKFAVEYMLPTGEAARIIGQERAASLQALMAPGFDTYDVVVEEAPSSPSVKDRSWAAVQQALPILLPMAQSGQLPPAVLAAMFATMPLPAALTDKITQALTAPPDPQMQAQQQEQAEIAKQGAVAKVERDRAAATKDYATAEKTQMETQLAPLEAAADVAAKADNAEQRSTQHMATMQDRAATREATERGQMMAPPPPPPADNGAVERVAVAAMQATQGMSREIGTLAKSIGTLAEATARPKRVVRDEAGNIVGVEAAEVS